MAVIEAIATTYLEADTSSVTFSSIPSTYEHLQLRMSLHSDRSANQDNIGIRFNGDTGANYASHTMRGRGTTTYAGAYTGLNQMYGWSASAANQPSTDYSVSVVDVLDYANGNKNATIRLTNATEMLTSSPYLWFTSGLWVSTAAVTSMTVVPVSGTNWTRGSEFTLYGLKSS